jgi:hypothetical protein
MTLGWLGNGIILLAMWRIGGKHVDGWVWSFIGNIVWCYYACQLGLADMFFVDFIAIVIAVISFIRWRKQ